MTSKIEELFANNFQEHKNVLELTLKNFKKDTIKISEIIFKTISNNKKIMWCGNGGSATDSMHLSSEFVGRFKMERSAQKSICLSSDIGNITCIANDYGYENIFSRQIEAIGNSGDILMCLSTSGNSKNIFNGIQAAKKKSITTVTFLGKDGGMCRGLSDYEIMIPSKSTARVQEMHLFLGHILCDMIDENLPK